MQKHLGFVAGIVINSLILVAVVNSQVKDQTTEKTRNLAQLKQEFFSQSAFLMVYEDNFVINEDMKADLLVYNADLILNATLNGRAVVVNGRLVVNANGSAEKLTAINGKVIVNNNPHVHSSIERLERSEYALNPEITDATTSPSGFADVVMKMDPGYKENTAAGISAKTPGSALNPPKLSEKVFDNLSVEVKAFNKEMENYNYEMKVLQDELEEVARNVKTDLQKGLVLHNYKDSYVHNDNRTFKFNFNEYEEPENDMIEPEEIIEKKLVEVKIDVLDNIYDKEDEIDYEDGYDWNFEKQKYNYNPSFEEEEEDDDASYNRVHYRHYDYRYNVTYPFNYRPNNDHFLFDYNRVEGLVLGLKLHKSNEMYFDKPFRIYGELGYEFQQGDFRYQLGLDKYWGYKYRFELGGEFHDITNTQDDWLIPATENAVNAIFLKRDYRDYFRTRGYSFHLSQNLNPTLKLTAAYKYDDYSSLDRNTNWAVFRPDQQFRHNPAIDDGRMVSVITQVEFNNSSMQSYRRQQSKRKGWQVLGRIERSFTELNSDFEFTKYTLLAKHYLPLSRWENLDMRLMLGAANGTLPRQETFYIGGISTMRAHNYKELAGNQVALLNVEYRLNSGKFDNDEVFILPVSLIFFMDTGYAWDRKISSIKNAFEGTHLADLETDLGIGFGDENDFVRVNVAKTVSGNKNSSYKINFRFNYAF